MSQNSVKNWKYAYINYLKHNIIQKEQEARIDTIVSNGIQGFKYMNKYCFGRSHFLIKRLF